MMTFHAPIIWTAEMDDTIHKAFLPDQPLVADPHSAAPWRVL